MVEELTEKRYPGGVSRIVPVNQLKVGIGYQRNRTRYQVVVRIQNSAQAAQLHKSIANRISWRSERWQVAKHATKTPGHRHIRGPLPMLCAFA